MTADSPVHPERSAPIHDAAELAINRRLARVGRAILDVQESGRDDLEMVHRLRVATRRAAAALDLFGPWTPAKRAKSVKRTLKRIRRAAGDARSADVFVGRVAAWIDDPPPGTHAEAWAATAGALVRDRERGLASLEDTLDGIGRGRFRSVRRKLVGSIGETGAGKPWKKMDSFGDLADHAVAVRRDRFDGLAAAGPTSVDDLHALRIEGKRFRYTLELVRGCLDPDEVAGRLDTLKRVQDFLGELNDLSELADVVRSLRAETRSADGLADRLDGCAAWLDAEAERTRTAFAEWHDGRPGPGRLDDGPADAGAADATVDRQIEGQIDEALESARGVWNGAGE